MSGDRPDLVEAGNEQVLGRIEDIPDPGSKGFVVNAPRLREIFVVRRGGEVFAYENSCPHTGAPLDWVPDQFLSLDRTQIQCATHHALFRIEDGFCLAGPCAGRYLQPVPVRLHDGVILIRAPERS